MIALSDLKRALDVSGTDDDIYLTALETRAVAWVEQQTGRFFGASGTSHTKFFSGNGTRTLWLNEEADSVTSVEERQKPGDSWTPIAAGADDGWELRGRRLLRKGWHVWRAGYEYRVIYVFGYAAGSEPGDIRDLVIDLVKLKYDQRSVSLAVAGESLGDERYQRAPFTGDVMNIPWVAETVGAWRGFRGVG